MLYPPNFYVESTSSWSPPKSFHIFSTTLSHLIPAHPYVIFSHTALSTMAGNFFSGISFTLYCHFNFLTSLFVSSAYMCLWRGGGCTQFVRGRSHMTIDPRIATMPGRSTSAFHQPDRHCLHQARSAVRCSASCIKGELHPSKNRA